MDFYSKRIKRLFPALIICLLLVYIFGWFILFNEEFIILRSHFGWAVAFLSNFKLLKESGYFDAAAETKPLLHLWSLAIEEQFYIVFPIVIYVIAKINFKEKLKKAFLLVALAALLSFSFNLWVVYLSGKSNASSYAYFFPLTRFWQIFTGALAFFAVLEFKNLPRVVAKFHLFYLAIVSLIIGLLFSDRNIYPGIWGVLPVLFAVICLVDSNTNWLKKSLLESFFIRFTGKISYSLYLFHWPILVYLLMMTHQNLTWPIKVIGILLTYVLSSFVTYLVEDRLRAKRSTLVTVSLVCTILITGFVGRFAVTPDLIEKRTANAEWDFYNRYIDPFYEKCGPLNLTSEGMDMCHFTAGNDSANTLIIGDSHSNRTALLFEAYKKESHENYNYIQIGRGSCMMLFDLYINSGCKEITEKIPEILKHYNKIQTVIISNRWTDEKKTDGQFRKSLLKTVKYYLDAGLKVKITYSVPNAIHPRNCLNRNIQLIYPKCETTLEIGNRNNNRYREILDEITTLHPSVTFFDPWPYFCDDHKCLVKNNGEALYQDDSHLSDAGVQFLIGKANKELNSFFKY